MAICGKATSNLMLRLRFPILKKFSLKIFFPLEQLKQNQRTFGSLDSDFIKSNRAKNTSKMLRYLMGLIYYSHTIFGNISGKNEVIFEFFSRLIFACGHAGYLVIFT